MVNSGNKIYNLYINSKNKNILDKPYDFTVIFDNEDIVLNPNEGMNVNVVSFSMMNSMYNVNQYTSNNLFNLVKDDGTKISITIPFGNYNVYSLMDKLNSLLINIINVTYDIATNTYIYTNVSTTNYKISPLNCSKLLGITNTTQILTTGTQSSYINMVDYQQVILKRPYINI